MSIWWELLPLATLAGTTVFCAVKWRLEVRRSEALDTQGYGQYARAEKLAGEITCLRMENAQLEEQARLERDRCIDLEDRLRKIERTRHNAAVTARAAQIAQQRAARDAKTARAA